MDAVTKQEGESLNIVEENIEALRNILPDAFTEDGIDFEALRQLLGDEVAIGEEKYGLNWHGKKKARQIALTPSTGTLRPCQDESVNWDATQNLFIEGDNLEVLKLLQRSYGGKIDMIYIDPPYNKGKDFVYPDNFADNLKTYLRYTGQIDSEGAKFSSNPETSGRFHTNWLNMMYPRLKLAKSLLSDSGVIFISIDEDELIRLEAICEEIFGDENVLGNFPVIMNLKGNQDAFGFAEAHEYLVVCCKSKDSCTINHLPLKDEEIAEGWLEDEYGLYKVADNLRATGVNAPREKRPNLWYPIFLVDDGREIYCTDDDKPRSPEHVSVWPINPEGQELSWYWGKSTFMQSRHNLIIKHTTNGWQFYRKQRPQLGDDPTKKAKSFFYKPEYSTSTATTKLKDLLGAKLFDGPKPIPLISDLILLGSSERSIIMDFFAGSGTTAHAVGEINAKFGTARTSVSVQLPEKLGDTDEAYRKGFKNIAELARHRIRKAYENVRVEHPGYDGDLGFKVFKLDSSNIRAWDPDASDLEQTLFDHAQHLVEGRSEQDVLYELLLKRGVNLTAPIEEKELAGKTVYSIGYGVLFACLNTSIAKEEIEALGQGIVEWHKELAPDSDAQVVFRDSAFADDIAKTNMTAILEQNGIAHVRSL
jgi:adenine-specific DNA-methyltransferase